MNWIWRSIVFNEKTLKDAVPCYDAYSQRRAAVIQEAKETEERTVPGSFHMDSDFDHQAGCGKKEVGIDDPERRKRFRLRMARAALEKRDKALKDKEAELSSVSSVDWKEKEIAALILVIEKP